MEPLRATIWLFFGLAGPGTVAACLVFKAPPWTFLDVAPPSPGSPLGRTPVRGHKAAFGIAAGDRKANRTGGLGIFWPSGLADFNRWLAQAGE